MRRDENNYKTDIWIFETKQIGKKKRETKKDINKRNTYGGKEKGNKMEECINYGHKQKEVEGNVKKKYQNTGHALEFQRDIESWGQNLPPRHGI